MKESTQRLIEALQLKVKEAKQILKFVQDNERLLDDLPDVSIYSSSVDFDHLSHEQILSVIQAFGGRWDKTPNYNRVDYSTKQNGITIRCWQGEPPPSCKVIEEEIEIPAQPARTEKRLKLVCKEEAKPLAELEVA